MVAPLFAHSADPQAALTEMAKLHRSADALIQSIYTHRLAWTARRTAAQEKVRCLYATVRTDPYATAALRRLLHCVAQQTGWPEVAPVIPSFGPQPGNTLLDGLLMLALRHTRWEQAPELWKPEPGSDRAQFGHLLRHLFPGYPAPAFLDAAWFEGFTPEAEAHRDWFLLLRRGHSLRTTALPVPLTSRAVHYFLQAPESLSIVAALRWGQVRALGGDPDLARAVGESRLACLQTDEPFWQTVLLFLAQSPGVDPAQVGPLIDYIYTRKFDESDAAADPPEPDFSMKGRTLPALMKRMEEWHAELARVSEVHSRSWEPSGIRGLRCEERDLYGAADEWTVQELTTSRELVDEGVAMRNCVRTYAGACRGKKTSIWSLRVRPGNGAQPYRLLTIEVNNARRAVVQVKMRCNRWLSSHLDKPRMQAAERMLKRWTEEAKLTITTYY